MEWHKATFVILISFTSAVSSPVYMLVSQKQDNMLDVQQTNNTLPLEKQQNIAGKNTDSGASSPGFKSQFYYLLLV